MDFTREPIIETVITPKEGCTLVVRSSKGSGQEEHFVDAIEVVVFGNAIFFRSLERPKAFLVPASDYEVLEVRETRLVLKNVGLDRSIKIAGGREAPLRSGREVTNGKTDRQVSSEKISPPTALPPSDAHLQEQPTGSLVGPAGPSEEVVEERIDKKRDRRRNYRRRRGKDEEGLKPSQEAVGSPDLRDPDNLSVELPPPHMTKAEIEASASSVPVAAVLSSLLAPPPNLISETIARYKDNVLFKGAFFTKDEEDEAREAEQQKNLEGETEDARGLETVEEEFYHLHEPEGSAEEIKVPNMTLDYPEYGASGAAVEEVSAKPSEDVLEPYITEEVLAQESIEVKSDTHQIEVEEEKAITDEKDSPQALLKKRKKSEEE